MAETTFALTHGQSGDAARLCGSGPTEGAWVQDEPALSTGRPLPGVELQVVDEDGRVKPERALGEIRVRSPYNFVGYFNNAEATASAVRDGWYYTGDLGYRVGAELFVTCRKKDLLIVGGVNVWPQDIEELAYAVPSVSAGRAVAFSEFDAANQTERVVILAESDAKGAEETKVIAAIRQRVLASLQLANFDVHLVSPGWLVKSSSGKISRSVSRDRWRAELRSSIKP
jgi:acyl-CoA synthetase (AMP-forming)/AMP-acid ligase II